VEEALRGVKKVVVGLILSRLGFSKKRVKLEGKRTKWSLNFN